MGENSREPKQRVLGQLGKRMAKWQWGQVNAAAFIEKERERPFLLTRAHAESQTVPTPFLLSPAPKLHAALGGSWW